MLDLPNICVTYSLSACLLCIETYLSIAGELQGSP